MPDWREDCCACFAEIVTREELTQVPIHEERHARSLLAALFAALSYFQFERLRNIAELDGVWRYLCSLTTARPGTFIDDPLMGIAMIADRFNEVGLGKSAANVTFESFLGRRWHAEEKEDRAIRDRIIRAAVHPLRGLQGGMLGEALRPGNIDLAQRLRRTDTHLIVEYDRAAAPASRIAVGLWLATIRMTAMAVRDRQTLLVTVDDPEFVAGLAFQISTDDLA
jgi:hypothetical protein